MGNTACCSNEGTKNEGGLTSAQDPRDEATPVTDQPIAAGVESAPALTSGGGAPAEYKVTLDKGTGARLGLDVDYMAERLVLPIMAITGGLAESWNTAHGDNKLAKGDSIVEVNGTRGNVAVMLEKCKSEKILELTLKRALTYDHLVTDLENLVTSKKCGPILVRLSWHDAGVYAEGRLSGGCPNAVMRFTDKGESTWAANAGLPTVALGLLAPIAKKYCPDLISNADLWSLAANVGIRIMGGPDIATRFGRVDATGSHESAEGQEGRLPDGDKGVQHLRDIFNPKGFDDKAIVALSGAHCVGKCHLDRSGFDGAWTEDPLKFDNSYFKDLSNKKYKSENTSKGKPQNRHSATGTIMLASDLALLEDDKFSQHVKRYAADQEAFFTDFTAVWVKLQENGCSNLRDIL